MRAEWPRPSECGFLGVLATKLRTVPQQLIISPAENSPERKPPCDSRQAARRWASHSIPSEKDARASGDLLVAALTHSILTRLPQSNGALASHPPAPEDSRDVARTRGSGGPGRIWVTWLWELALASSCLTVTELGRPEDRARRLRQEETSVLPSPSRKVRFGEGHPPHKEPSASHFCNLHKKARCTCFFR